MLYIGYLWQARVLNFEIVLESADVECFVDLAITAFVLLLGDLFFHSRLLENRGSAFCPWPDELPRTRGFAEFDSMHPEPKRFF